MGQYFRLCSRKFVSWTVFLKAISSWTISSGCLQNWSFAFEILYPILENASVMDTPFWIRSFKIMTPLGGTYLYRKCMGVPPRPPATLGCRYQKLCSATLMFQNIFNIFRKDHSVHLCTSWFNLHIINMLQSTAYRKYQLLPSCTNGFSVIGCYMLQGSNILQKLRFLITGNGSCYQFKSK